MLYATQKYITQNKIINFLYFLDLVSKLGILRCPDNSIKIKINKLMMNATII